MDDAEVDSALSHKRRVYLDADIGSTLEFVKIGTTVFNNKTFEMDDEGALGRIVDDLRDEFLANGYEIVDSPEDSEFVVSLERLVTYNYPSGFGVLGAGFFVHQAFGLHPPIQFQARLMARIHYPNSKKSLRRADFDQVALSDVKFIYNDWESMPDSAKRALMDLMQAELKDAGKSIFERLRLVRASNEGQPPQMGAVD